MDPSLPWDDQVEVHLNFFNVHLSKFAAFYPSVKWRQNNKKVQKLREEMIKSRGNNYVGFLFFPVHSTLGISKKLFISFVSTLQEGTQRLKLTLRMLIYCIQLWNRQIKQNIIDLILFGHYGNPLGADGTQVGVQPDMPRWLLDVPEIYDPNVQVILYCRQMNLWCFYMFI